MTTPQDTAQNAAASIDALKAMADEALSRELHAITETAGDGQAVALQLKHHNTLDELIGAAAWLARDLADVLLKVATDNDPHSVMGSDLPARIRQAEIRLELLREMSR